jgi:hypothetical protein
LRRQGSRASRADAFWLAADASQFVSRFILCLIEIAQVHRRAFATVDPTLPHAIASSSRFSAARCHCTASSSGQWLGRCATSARPVTAAPKNKPAPYSQAARDNHLPPHSALHPISRSCLSRKPENRASFFQDTCRLVTSQLHCTMAPRNNAHSAPAEISLAHLKNCLVNLPSSLVNLLVNINIVSNLPYWSPKISRQRF